MRRTINAVSLFCGAGGDSTGAAQAAEELHLKYRALAINHWSVAVQTMRANYPHSRVLDMDIASAVPADVYRAKTLDLLWASPSCTHHSRARGGRPRQNQLRSQPELCHTWVDQIPTRHVIVENVPEIVEWGPIGMDGRPLASRAGDSFRAWIAGWEARGYDVEWRILNCADYGDATTRRRFFMQAVKKGCGKIVWPEPEYTEDPQPDLFRELKPWRGIRECLDLNDLGTSVFGRKKPLSKNTMRRIEIGLRKFCGIDIRPFIVKLYGTGTVESVDRPLSTITTSGKHHLLAQPFIVKMRSHATVGSVDEPLSTVTGHTVNHLLATPYIMPIQNNGAMQPVTKPMPTQTSKAHMAMVTPLVLGQQSPAAARPVTRPCPAILTSGAIQLVTPVVFDNANGGTIVGADKPINTITGKDNHMVATLLQLPDGRCVDVFVRMLKVEELAAAHSFPRGYKLAGTKTQQIRQIGNSVPVRTAKALCMAAMSDLIRKGHSLDETRKTEQPRRTK